MTKFDEALEVARKTARNSEEENKNYLALYLQFFDTTFYLPVDEEVDGRAAPGSGGTRRGFRLPKALAASPATPEEVPLRRVSDDA